MKDILFEITLTNGKHITWMNARDYKDAVISARIRFGKDIKVKRVVSMSSEKAFGKME